MEVFPDYSPYSLSELQAVLLHTDQKNSGGLYEEVLAEIQRREAQPEPTRKKFLTQPEPPKQSVFIQPNRPKKGFFRQPERFISHAFAGLVVGMMGYSVYALVVCMNTPNYRVAGPSLLWDLFGLIIPLLSTIYGYRRATRAPIAVLDHPLANIGLIILATMLWHVDLFLVYATAMSGYC